MVSGRENKKSKKQKPDIGGLKRRSEVKTIENCSTNPITDATPRTRSMVQRTTNL